MAITECGKCGGQYSDLADECPHCIRNEKKSEKKREIGDKAIRWLIYLCIFIALIVGSVFLLVDEKTEYNETLSALKKPLKASSNSIEEWRKGGTLHGAKVKEWVNSSFENKLATTSDWIEKTADYESNDGLKEMATGLVSCLDEMVDDSENLDIADLALLCMGSMSFSEKKK